MDIILTGVVGSTAYGLAGPDSDVDLLSVAVAPLSGVLGLDGPALVSRSLVTSAPDHAVHELGKFASLALAANPTLLELLWLPEFRHASPAGLALVSAREAFLSAPRVRAAYVGYARSQASRIRSRSQRGLQGFSSDVRLRTAKHARHCARLLLMAEQLLTRGSMLLDVSSQRDWLAQMEQMAVSCPREFGEEFDRLALRLEGLASCLPDRPDRARVDDLVVRIRLGEIPA